MNKIAFLCLLLMMCGCSTVKFLPMGSSYEVYQEERQVSALTEQTIDDKILFETKKQTAFWKDVAKTLLYVWAYKEIND